MNRKEKNQKSELMTQRILMILLLFAIFYGLIYSFESNFSAENDTNNDAYQNITEIAVGSLEDQHQIFEDTMELSVDYSPYNVTTDDDFGADFEVQELLHQADDQEQLSENEDLASDVEQIWIDDEYRYYRDFIINNSGDDGTIGLVPGRRNTRSYSPSETNEIIQNIFSSNENINYFTNILKIYNPNISEQEVLDYLNSFQIVVGPNVNHYLEIVRNGSFGTTLLSVDSNRMISFESIALNSRLTWSMHNDNELSSLRRLIREEFFQAHQYNSVVASLYNSGYLNEVAGIDSPEKVVYSISETCFRSFLELLPQQKYIADQGLSGNAYNFYVGGQYIDGQANSSQTIDIAYNLMTSFIENDLGVETTPEAFLSVNYVEHINDLFREKYMDYYLELGFNEADVQIWNLVGMKRVNYNNSENSLDIPSLLEFPED